MTRPVLVLAGPTAVGKSSLALDIAEKVGGVILSADSRQLYRGMDIGTASPTPTDRARVPHRLLDIFAPGERVSAGAWLERAREEIDALQADNRSVVVVGGSTLYVHALVSGLADLPPLPVDLERSLMEEVTSGNADDLFRELLAADPQAAASLDATKTHRLVRWVGVLRQTGRPPSELWAESQRAGLPAHLVVLERPRPDLYARIERRVDQMMVEGLLQEVRELAANASALPTLRSTIGYQELLPVLSGDRALDEAVRLIKRNSRRYAKRQLTWYRRYPEAVWLDASAATPDSVLEAVAPWP